MKNKFLTMLQKLAKSDIAGDFSFIDKELVCKEYWIVILQIYHQEMLREIEGVLQARDLYASSQIVEEEAEVDGIDIVFVENGSMFIPFPGLDAADGTGLIDLW